MQNLGQTIIAIMSRRPGISDTELAFAIHGRNVQRLVNGECRYLVRAGKLVRQP